MGSGLAAADVAAGTGWWAVPFAVVSAPLGAIWGLSFLYGVIPAPKPPDELLTRLTAITNDLVSQVGITAPTVFVSVRATGAGVSWCGAQPRMVFPASWIARLTDAELRAYVAHELAHTVQPAFRRLSSTRLTSRAAGASLALPPWLLLPADTGTRTVVIVIYAFIPLALTVAIAGRRLMQRARLGELEVDADGRAVAWGTAPEVLATTLGRLEQPELIVHPALITRVLAMVLLLPYAVSTTLPQRADLLRSRREGVSEPWRVWRR